ncbi:hypothetical protein AVEN_142615-1 [Araneus ventricosus]|uniref:Uncharacterized protein n=1 Tax=Araneus ventricosus TaxID=182803 RepID=A0A4Y2GA50_ARAVE|nr:hypothetical protein AVEN_142615-1 [Araneus ventricosus]
MNLMDLVHVHSEPSKCMDVQAQMRYYKDTEIMEILFIKMRAFPKEASNHFLQPYTLTNTGYLYRMNAFLLKTTFVQRISVNAHGSLFNSSVFLSSGNSKGFKLAVVNM